jgi:hypothetical protein
MPDPAPKPDAIDQADAQFRKSQTLEELMAGVAPLTPRERPRHPRLDP